MVKSDETERSCVILQPLSLNQAETFVTTQVVPINVTKFILQLSPQFKVKSACLLIHITLQTSLQNLDHSRLSNCRGYIHLLSKS